MLCLYRLDEHDGEISRRQLNGLRTGRLEPTAGFSLCLIFPTVWEATAVSASLHA